jgi:hypothetical protein
MLAKFDAFHNSRPGYAIFSVFGLAVAFLFINYSIDTGNWFDYLITLLALVVFLQNFTRFIASFKKGKRRGR